MTSNALLFDRAFIFGLTGEKTLSLKAGAWINRINYCLVCFCQLLHISESEQVILSHMQYLVLK